MKNAGATEKIKNSTTSNNNKKKKKEPQQHFYFIHIEGGKTK